MRRYKPSFLQRFGSLALLRALVVASLVSLATAPVFAQNQAGRSLPQPPAGADISPNDLKSLIESLQNEGARARLIVQLKALLAAKQAAEPTVRPARRFGPFARLTDDLTRTGQNIVNGTTILFEQPHLGDWFVRQLEDPARRGVWTRAAWTFFGVLFVAFAAQWAVLRLAARSRRRLEMAEPDGWSARATRSFLRAGLEILPLAAFAIAAHAIAPVLKPEALTLSIVLVVVDASVVARTIIALIRVGVAPRVPALRLIPLANDDATYLYVWARRLVNFSVYGALIGEVAGLAGAETVSVEAIDFVFGLVLMLMLVALILQNRSAVARVIRGEAPERAAASGVGVARRQFADIWHVLAVLYVVTSFMIWLLRIDGGFDLILRGTAATLAIFAIAYLLSVALRRVVERGLRIDDDLKARYPGIEVRANRYLAIVQFALRGLVAAIALVASLEAWGLDAFSWLVSGFGRRLIGSLAISAVVIVLAVIVWELVSSWIQRTLTKAEGGEAEISARARTLLPLVRNVLMVSLSVLVVLLVLSEFGVNIGPLLAGAGIIGLAVGFGAQTLVKDVITGFFILMENQISVGDVASVGSHTGLVEAISIRTIRMRDLGGNVHIVPFSEVTTVENMTKDFSRYVFDVGVAYREDTDEVVEVLTQIGAEMQADATYGEMILEPLEILGVDKFADSAVVVRARITTKPVMQWRVGREFNRRMKKRFDELGIEIPFPHRTLYFGIDKAGEARPARVRVDQGSSTGPVEAT